MNAIIRDIIHTRLGDTNIDDEANLHDLGADSLMHFDIVTEIEAELEISIDDEAAEDALTILDFINIAKESPSNIIH